MVTCDQWLPPHPPQWRSRGGHWGRWTHGLWRPSLSHMLFLVSCAISNRSVSHLSLNFLICVHTHRYTHTNIYPCAMHTHQCIHSCLILTTAPIPEAKFLSLPDISSTRTVLRITFKNQKKESWMFSTLKKKINIRGDRYVHPDLYITQCILGWSVT